MIVGIGLFGKVHKMSHGAYIATQFGHAMWVPLIPMGSYIVFSKSGNTFQGKKIPFYKFSIAIAYLRALAIVGTISLPIHLLMDDNPITNNTRGVFNNFPFLFWASCSTFCLVLAVLLYVHPRIKNASASVEKWLHDQHLSTPSA